MNWRQEGQIRENVVMDADASNAATARSRGLG